MDIDLKAKAAAKKVFLERKDSEDVNAGALKRPEKERLERVDPTDQNEVQEIFTDALTLTPDSQETVQSLSDNRLVEPSRARLDREDSLGPSKEIAMLQIKLGFFDYPLISPAFKRDKKVILAAVTQNG